MPRLVPRQNQSFAFMLPVNNGLLNFEMDDSEIGRSAAVFPIVAPEDIIAAVDLYDIVSSLFSPHSSLYPQQCQIIKSFSL